MRTTFLLLSGLMVTVSGADLKYKISPTSVVRGETTTITVDAANCPSDGTPALDGNSVSISGSGIAITENSAHVTNCSVEVTARVANDATLGTRTVLIYDKDRKNRLTSLEMEVADILPGPVPPGLKPQVDVMYNILSENGCSDQFGNRVASRYFCIEVQLGNNTGYSLLLAGVGFMRTLPGLTFRESNAGYLQIRSVLQREQNISGRNLTLRSLEAAGVVIAGFTPFSGNAGRRGRLGIWSSLVGNVVAGAYSELIPDRTIRQLATLDDAALRDGRLIPNNSPVKFTVFVDRESIVPLLADPKCYEAYLRGETKRELQRVKVDLKVAARDNRMTSAQIQSLDQEKTRLEATVRVLESEQGSKSGGAGANEPNTCEAGKIPKSKSKFNLIGRPMAAREGDLLAVRRALGSLIIVGDEIEYKQRIRVDSSAVNPEVRANPVVVGVENGDSAKQGQTVKALTLIGKTLGGASVTASNCITTPIKSSVDAAGARLTLQDLAVPESCTDPVLHLVIQTGASLSALFDVPIEAMKPTITKVEPATFEVTDGTAQTVQLKVTGTGLAGVTVKAAVNVGSTATEVTAKNVKPTTTTVDFDLDLPAGVVKVDATIDVTVSNRALEGKKTAATKLVKKP